MKLAYRCGVVAMTLAVLTNAAPGFAQDTKPSTTPALTKPPVAAPAAAAPAVTTTAATPATPPPAAEPAVPPPAAASDTPPTAATDAVPSSALLSFPPAGAGEACFPTCRKGFVCHAGACISSCNPGCAADERCAEDNGAHECVPKYATHFADVELPAIEPGAEAHEGFFFRGTLGIGGGGSQRDTRNGKVKYTGGAGFLSVDVGGTVLENFAIFGRLSNFTLIEPQLEVDDRVLSDAIDDNVSFSMLAIGGSYYFMPINLYVGGAIGAAGATLGDSSDDDLRSRLGFGIDLEAGKEWWVNEDWGMGVALRLSFSNVPPGRRWTDQGKHLRALGLGVLFSATYN